MGGTESKSINGDNKPDEDEQYHTPIANRRVKTLTDPRSPTEEVQRTPVQRAVDEDSEFQDPRSPAVARTPVPDDSDPRSPTAGREPGPFVFPQPSDDPRSPTKTVARTPLTKDAPAELSIETVTVHQSDTNESCESSTSNNNQDNDVIPKSASDIEPSEPGIFQIDSEKENLVGEDSSSEVVEETQKSELVKSNTPENEMELTNMMEKQTLANEETEDQDQATLVLSDREMIFLAEAPPSSSSSKAKKHSIRRSLKEKFTSTSQRSPLSTRNLLEDSPDPARRVNLRQQGSTATQRMGVAYQKTGVRRTLAKGNQYTVQTVGRYQPVPDKENF
ncbi:uncharacterized protein LOC754059 isoform X2 [Strongylocentrotus purpuratus]|nr:uncharacterized protein LOC754059 isoform X2 [Strongylocentrotus purpuratus]XP_030842727.1 uncharacterized protein LOC754059 isoform X2 [Strongylocentrotus purpuratus]XP_030842728.1 uncharacterized protein LOC754059 isoform X2 [Strongylocentrotus purpuratus]